MVEPMIPNNSPPWSRTTKTIVVVSVLLLLALLVMRFRTLLALSLIHISEPTRPY